MPSTAELEEIGDTFGDLVGDAMGRFGFVHDPGGLFGRQPLEDLDQFGGLDTEGGHQVLRGVVLLPVPDRRERGQPPLEFCHIEFCHGPRSTTAAPDTAAPDAPRGVRRRGRREGAGGGLYDRP
ncbi:hypothetical protein SMICM17S_01123 [Streptomyces microflavus]